MQRQFLSFSCFVNVCCKENACMIPGISASSISFRANELTSVRGAFDAKLDENHKTAQGQNGMVTSSNNSQMNNQIPMQGGQKLDIIA